MRPTLSIALLLLGANLMPCALAEPTAIPQTQATATAEAEAIAIEKTLILATLLQAEESADGNTLSTSAQNMQRCLNFAQTQGAPAAFIDLLKASAQETNLEESTALAQQIEALLSSYQIDLLRLHVWTSICLMDADTSEQWLSGDEGSQALRAELLSTEASFIASLSVEEFQRSAEAIKKALLLLGFYNIKDQHRISDEHLAQVISFANAQGAPKVFERLLKADASRTIAPKMRYEANNFLNQLLEAYLVDRKAIRNYAEGCGITADEMIELLTSQALGIKEGFNLLPKISAQLTKEQAAECSEQWLMDTRHLAETLAEITVENAKDADLQDIAKRIPSYMRAQSISLKRDPELRQLIDSVHPIRNKHLDIALRVSQQQLYRLLLLKEALPIELRAILAEFL